MLTRNDRQLVIDRRFGGLPEIAHGGYLAGVLATALGGTGAEIRLRQPVATGRALSLERADGERVELRDGDTLLAEALDCPQLWSLIVFAPAATTERVVTAIGRQTAATASWGVPLGRARGRTGENALDARREK